MSSTPPRTFQRRFAGWGRFIPGYTGYRDKDRRRDADRLVREHLARDLRAIAARLENVSRNLANQRRIHDVGPVEDDLKMLRHLIDRIATASYGYGGLFGDRPVDERALDQIRLFDEALGESVAEIEAPIAELERSSSTDADIAPVVAQIDAAIRATLSRFELRAEVASSGMPASEDKAASALAVLGTPGAKAGATAWEMAIGDALSIGASNYVVDSVIEIEGQGIALRLFRVATAPDRWLVAPRDPSQTPAEMISATGTVPSGDHPVIGGRPFTLATSGRGTAEVTGSSGNSGKRSVTLTQFQEDGNLGRALVLDWGDEKLLLVGSALDSETIQLYDPAKTGS